MKGSLKDLDSRVTQQMITSISTFVDSTRYRQINVLKLNRLIQDLQVGLFWDIKQKNQKSR